MYPIQQNTSAIPLYFYLTDSSDHLSPKLGATPTVTLSKNGAAMGAAIGAVTEIGNGHYIVAGNATDENTLGPIALHATATGADDCDMIAAIVVAYNPYNSKFGITYPVLGADSKVLISTDAQDLSATLSINSKRIGGTNQTGLDIAANYTAARATKLDQLDSIASIKAITDQIRFTIANKIDSTIQAGGDFAQAAADKVWATVARTLTAFGFNVTLTSGERDFVADALIARNIKGGSSSGRTVGQAFAVSRNKVVIAGGTLTVYDTDDVTPLWTGIVTQTAGDPISTIDPT